MILRCLAAESLRQVLAHPNAVAILYLHSLDAHADIALVHVDDGCAIRRNGRMGVAVGLGCRSPECAAIGAQDLEVVLAVFGQRIAAVGDPPIGRRGGTGWLPHAVSKPGDA